MSKPSGSNTPPKSKAPRNVGRVFGTSEVLTAAMLVLVTTVLGVGIFAASVALMSGWGRDVVNPSSLEPGLGLSSQALSLAFALAGAFASTVVAFTALKAQTSANRAQQEAEAARDEAARRDALQRRSAELRSDFARHAKLIGAIHEVFVAAEVVVEFVVEDVSLLLDTATDQAGEVPRLQRDRCVDAIITANRQFWKALAETGETATPQLALDRMWSDHFVGGKTRSHFVDLAQASGLFRQTVASPDRLKPVILSSMGTPMTPVVAGNVVSLIFAKASDHVSREISGQLKTIAEEIVSDNASLSDQMKEDIEKAKTVVWALVEGQQEVADLSATAKQTMEEIETLNGLIEPDAVSQLARGELDEKLETTAVALEKLAHDAKEIRLALPDSFYAIHLMEVAQERVDDLLTEVGMSAMTMLDRLREANAGLGSRVVEALTLARHDATRQNSDALAALTALVAGAIILPDGALLRLRDADDQLWKLNPGLALIADLSSVYQARCSDPDTTEPNTNELEVLDLARLLSDDSILQTPVSSETYRESRISLIGQLPVALDIFWQQLRNRRGDFLDVLMHQLSYGYHYRPRLGSEAGRKTVERILTGQGLTNARLEIEPMPKETATITEARGIASGEKEEVPF